MELTADERAQINRENPDCYFCLVVGYGVSAIVAIPRRHGDKRVASMPGLTGELLHGATLRLLTA